MSGLYFLGVKKTTIKKIPPFKYIFDWRDKRAYEKILKTVTAQYSVQPISETERMISYSLNNRNLQLVFRNFPSSDLSVFNQVFLRNCYLPIIKKMLEYTDALSPLKIMDAGANVGYSCLYFKTFFPNAKIVAIEPEKSNSNQLQKNVSANNYNLSALIKGALWYRSSFLEVVRDFRDNREAAFTVVETTSPTQVMGFGFDEILSQNAWDNVDLVKIDIEGSERFLFDTEKKADAILNRTGFLAIEIHDEFNIRSTIYRHLKRNGFSYFEFEDLTLAINKKRIGS